MSESARPPGPSSPDVSNEVQGPAEARGRREPMKLHLVFVLGFLASTVVLVGTIWLFAAYETATWWPWSDATRLTQDQLFEIIRNAVTTAAALGVGVTLFFSYRRQQSTEDTLRIGAEAQRTAAKAQETAAAALELSNKQHGLDQQRRLDAITSGLRDRYAIAAEQLGSAHLAVRLAGIYSLAALADDWADFGNEDERQVCIDLLCAYFRSQPDENAATRKELVDATLQLVQGRLGRNAERKNWSSQRIHLAKPGVLPTLGPLLIQPKGALKIEDALVAHKRFREIEVYGGLFELAGLHVRQTMIISQTKITGSGMMRISLQGQSSERPKPARRPTIVFSGLQIENGSLDVTASGTALMFNGCVFGENAALTLSVERASEADYPGRVSFSNCTFRSNVFGEDDWAPEDPLFRLNADFLRVDKKCVFENGVHVLEPFSKLHPGTEL